MFKIQMDLKLRFPINSTYMIYCFSLYLNIIELKIKT